jgi:hypothetical protein
MVRSVVRINRVAFFRFHSHLLTIAAWSASTPF